jgi:hypothetical protein
LRVIDIPIVQYFSGGKVDAGGPLARFLPPVPENVARAFLADHSTRGAWVLDPFGSSPHFAIEMARTGARVLVTAGNPVNRFLLDLAAHPPALGDLQAALADLAAARKDNERMETHIQALYLTRCANCGRELAAEAFLWDNRSGKMTGRIYNCVCGDGGERPAAPEDLEHAAAWARSDALHRSRALERVAPRDDPDRPYAEEALNIYMPRAVYALGTLINRLDAISTTVERRRCIIALLLWACDLSNSLWQHPPERPRPKQLTFPSVFRENNVWLALEAGVKAWASEEPPVPHTLWPEEPPETGGLCIYEGRFRELAPELSEIPIEVVAGAIPRPNQAFWTLSALWAGWLWGREAVGPFKSALRRRRYDWQWHAEALKALFTSLAGVVAPEPPFFGVLAEPEPAFITAALLAARMAGFELSGLAMRGELEPIQFLWNKVENPRPTKLALDANFARRSILEILESHGEPMPYIHLHTAVMAAFAGKGMLPESGESLSAVETTIHAALDHPEFVDIEGRSTPETGTWALKKWGEQGQFEGMGS